MVQISARSEATPDSKASLKKLEILSAASRVFRERGLHATGMREIAAESGMQVGNLYYYFRNKQDLLAFCQGHTLTGLLEMIEQVKDRKLRADTQLYLVVLGHVVRLNEETPGSLAHLEVEALEPEPRGPILRKRDRYEASIRSIVEKGIRQGIFRKTDPKVATMALLGSVNWTVKWFQSDGAQSSAEIGRNFAEILVRGLLRDDRKLCLPSEDQAQSLGG